VSVNIFIKFSNFSVKSKFIFCRDSFRFTNFFFLKFFKQTIFLIFSNFSFFFIAHLIYALFYRIFISIAFAALPAVLVLNFCTFFLKIICIILTKAAFSAALSRVSLIRYSDIILQHFFSNFFLSFLFLNVKPLFSQHLF
jgi:hypothetical protein